MSKIRIGRKFIGFIVTLITLTVLGIIGKGTEMAPYIVGLFVAYTTGNVAQKATMKEQHVTVEEQPVTVEGNNER